MTPKGSAKVLASRGHGLISPVVAHPLVEGNRDDVGGRGGDPIREGGDEGCRQPRIGIADEDQASLHASQDAAEQESVGVLKDVLADETPTCGSWVPGPGVVGVSNSSR